MHISKGSAAIAGIAIVVSGLGSQAADATDHDSVDQAVRAATSHAAATKAGSGQQFTAVDEITDRDGTSHVRLHRTYHGLEVVGGDLVVHQTKSGGWRGSSQTLAKAPDLGVKPTVAAGAADGAALRRTTTRRAKALPAVLVVDATGVKPKLAWRVITTGMQSDGTPSREATYIDAKTGKVLRSEEQIINVDGTGNSLYAGAVTLALTQSGSSYQLRDSTRGGTYTTNLNHAESGTGSIFTSSDTVFGNGSNSNPETAAADAHYGVAKTWDYYKDTFGRLGVAGDGRGTYNRVHYGTNYVNAYWDGSRMTYGDGDGVTAGPLVSIDVTGHEMTHGVTQHTAALAYSGESGGLNEATSDIFGTMVEFYANNPSEPANYLIGERFDLADHDGFRRMDDPASDGKSANCWSSGVGNLNVHNSSGVGNHFFYLLAEGSGAKTIGGVAHNSPTCNGSTVTGIGRKDAAAIWYRALTVYMTSRTNFSGARSATVRAASDLFGASSTQARTVAAAWDAVSVR